MKRALLIAGGTVGGLGAVLAITPPQLNSTELALTSSNPLGGAAGAASPSASSPSQSTSTNDPKVTSNTSASGTTTKSSSSKTSAVQGGTTSSGTSSTSATGSTTSGTSTNSSAQPSTAPKTGVSGDFTGTPINVGYGIVQVKITVENGKITDAVAVQAPSGRNDRYTNYAIPILKKQTLEAQSDAISGVSGASYTAYGWYKSLQSALTKAGML